jgi:hypothetical protein
MMPACQEQPSLVQQLPPATRAPVFKASGLLVLGVLGYGTQTLTPDFRDNLKMMAFYGPVLAIPLAVICPVVVAAIWFAARTVVGVGRARRVTLWMTGTAAVALIVAGFYESRPIAWFRDLVIDPPPAVLKNLRVQEFSSFNDGASYVLGFETDAAGFDAIRWQLGLKAVPLDENGPKDAAGVSKYLEMNRVGNWFSHSDFFVPPTSPRYYQGHKVAAITDESEHHVYIYVDRHYDVGSKPTK